MKEKKNLQDSRIVFNARRISILNNGKCVTAVKELCVVVDLVFVAGRDIDMKFNDLNPTLKIKKILRKRAIKNVEEHISYQQKKVSDYSVDELRKLILSEEKKILHGAGWKGAIVAVGAMFGITNF